MGGALRVARVTDSGRVQECCLAQYATTSPAAPSRWRSRPACNSRASVSIVLAMAVSAHLLIVAMPGEVVARPGARDLVAAFARAADAIRVHQRAVLDRRRP